MLHNHHLTPETICVLLGCVATYWLLIAWVVSRTPRAPSVAQAASTLSAAAHASRRARTDARHAQLRAELAR